MKPRERKSKHLMTIADLTISHGYPFSRLVGDGKDIPEADWRSAMAWRDRHPHDCDALLGWQCVAVHYPGGWPAFIKKIEARKRVTHKPDPIAA